MRDKLDESKFVPLHVHNSFSFKDGIGTPQSRVKWAKEKGKVAVSTSNHGNVADWIQIYTESQKAGLKPILGCEFYFHRNGHLLEPALLEVTEENAKIKQGFKKVNHVTLFAKTLEGYYNMLKIHNEAWMKRYYYRPIVSAESVQRNHAGIIALSGCSNSEINHLINKKNKLTSNEYRLNMKATFDDKVRSLGNLYKGKLKSIEDSGLDAADFAYKEAHEAWVAKDYRAWLEENIKVRDDEFLQTVDEKVSDLIDWWHDIFGDDFYIELMPIDYSDQKKINEELIRIAKYKGIPTVITTDSHYIDQKEARIQEMQMLSDQKRTYQELVDDVKNQTNKIWTIKSDDLYYKTVEQVYQSYLSGHKSDVFTEEVFWNSLINVTKVVDSVEAFTIDTSSKMPVLYKDGYDILIRKIKEGKNRLGITKEKMGEEAYKVYFKRIARELEVIKAKNYTDYFLIVEDMIRYAKDTYGEWTVGPGRGSAAGSLVNYLIGITNVDPLKHQLLFERFLDPSRDDPPDIDCLHELTPVAMAEGDYKLLKDIRAGDKVFDHEGYPREVLNISTRIAQPTKEMVLEIIVQYQNGDYRNQGSFICPNHHRMVDAYGQIITAGELKVGDKIQTGDGLSVSVVSISELNVPYDEVRLVDIQVDVSKTFQILTFRLSNNTAWGIIEEEYAEQIKV